MGKTPGATYSRPLPLICVRSIDAAEQPSHEGRGVIAVDEEDLLERQSCAYTVLADAVLSHPWPGAHRISTSTAYTNMT